MSKNGALAGKTAFITGASGGIGSACAEYLARDGAAVLLMARKQAALDATKAKIAKAVPGARVELYAGDAGKAEDVEAAIKQAYAMQKRLDIAVPTVGGGSFRPLLMHTAETLTSELALNIVTAFLTIRYAVPLMEPGGSVVCISSTAAKLPFGGLSAYHTAKGGLENLIRAAAEELGAAGIRVNAVRPGLTRSNGTGDLIANPDIVKLFTDEFPLARVGEPEDIAAAVRFLAGPESSWLTGQSFAVDGGNEIRKNPDLSFMLKQMVGEQAFDTLRRGKIPVTAAEIVAWVKAAQGIDLPEKLAAEMAIEQSAATRVALAALASVGIEGEPADFDAVLAGYADRDP